MKEITIMKNAESGSITTFIVPKSGITSNDFCIASQFNRTDIAGVIHKAEAIAVNIETIFNLIFLLTNNETKAPNNRVKSPNKKLFIYLSQLCLRNYCKSNKKEYQGQNKIK